MTRLSNASAACLGIVAALGTWTWAREARAAAPETVAISVPGSGLRAGVAPAHGGELAGLQVRYRGRWIELLYRGMDFSPTSDWAGHAPILWPAVGRNFLDAPQGGGLPAGEAAGPGWRWNGATYPMPIHGFARDLPWRVESVRRGAHAAVVTLSLSDDARTRASFPFGFRVTSRYALRGQVLDIRQTVQADARNSGPMPFSIGNHITFNLPLVPGGDPQAVTVRSPLELQVVTDDKGRPTGEVRRADFAHGMAISAMAPRVAISLAGRGPEDAWASIDDPAGLTVTVSHHESERPPGTPVLFNLWGDAHAGFFAPEPWVGKQNSLSSGDGVIRLAPGHTFTWTIRIAISPVRSRR